MCVLLLLSGVTYHLADLSMGSVGDDLSILGYFSVQKS